MNFDKVEKISEDTIAVTKTVKNTTTQNFSYGDLIKQKEAIEAQKAREIQQRDTEIAEVITLIEECKKLGVGEN